MMKLPLLLLTILLLASSACRFTGGETPTPELLTLPAPESSTFTPQNIRVGDPNVNYANVEFTADGKYMVWFEMARDGSGLGTVWHCGVDPETGELIPADGKGFRAFESNYMGRANPGMDALGAYYVGMDQAGALFLVRPTGPTSGNETVLSTPPDLTRRGIYPTVLPDQAAGYVFWIKNEKVPGGGTDPRNAWVELQYISLADPAQVHIIERQDRPRRGFAPLDVAFARWMKGKPILTYGSRDANGTIQVRAFDASQPSRAAQDVTNDPHGKIDPYSWVFNGREILLPGIDGKAETYVYTRDEGEALFSLAEIITPPASALTRPGLAQSNEPFVWDGRAYTVYQINEKGLGFWDTTFANAGEIWLSTVLQDPPQQWLLTDSQTAKAEPEPYVGASRVWVFYNVIEGDGFLTGLWGLWRAETPFH